jgi:cyclopropane fatty-acyl-phospholipid synthase-like methyltransferase
MFIKKCRSCGSKNLKKLFSLGKLSFTGKFASSKIENIPSADLSMIKCSDCDLVQLGQNFNMNYMYSSDYGYRTGINSTMTNHMKMICLKLKKKANLQKGDAILDIASNDGTLLNFYGKDFFKVGIDPTIKKYKKYYSKINISISNFFSFNRIRKYTKKKFKIITALSVFYDMKNPNIFLNDVYKLLDDNGVLLLEQADLHSIIKLKMFDTICHEHLEYYSHDLIFQLAKKNNFKVFDIQSNDINGASTQYYLCKNNSKYKVNNKKINGFLSREKKLKLNKEKTYKIFFNEIELISKNLRNLLIGLKKQKKTIHGYGASTKGNVLLQYFKIGKNIIDCISDRNPVKNGKYTPGTKIKIVSEQISRKLNPDYYLVLPWHFKDEILKREKKIMNSGTKFIFPLPKIKIISK